MTKRLYLLAILLIGALALSACGGAPQPSGGGDVAPTRPSQENGNSQAEPTEAPAPEPTEATSSGGDEPLELTDVFAGLEGLNSYESTFSMSFAGADAQGQAQNAQWTFSEAFSKEPPAKRTSFNGIGGQDTGGFEVIQVDGKTYSVIGDICTSSDSTDDLASSAPFSPSDIIGDIRSAQLVGSENVNGIQARHYQVDLSNFLALGYTQAKAEAWVAESGGFVVKYAFEATGKDSFFNTGSDAEGTIRWDYEVTSVNQPVNITAPEDCGGAPADVPLMADAAEQSSFGDITTYTSASSFDDVVAFYKAQMPANGWTESPDGLAATGFAQLAFTKEGRTASISITTDTSTNKTTVLITLSEQ